MIILSVQKQNIDTRIKSRFNIYIVTDAVIMFCGNFHHVMFKFPHLLLLVFGCSLSLTDAALRGRESPENVGASLCRKKQILQPIRAGTVRIFVEHKGSSKKKMWNVFARVCLHASVGVNGGTDISLRIKSGPDWLLSACDLIARHTNMHEYGCYFIIMFCD